MKSAVGISHEAGLNFFFRCCLRNKGEKGKLFESAYVLSLCDDFLRRTFTRDYKIKKEISSLEWAEAMSKLIFGTFASRQKYESVDDFSVKRGLEVFSMPHPMGVFTYVYVDQ